MHKLFYPKLAASNIKKNGKTYFPYILTCILTVMMYYIMVSLSKNSGIMQLSGSLALMLELGAVVIAIFAVIFLFYTNSFLVKRRKKEFGLLNILGMEKKHISRVVAWETVYTFALAIGVGVPGGIVLSKLMMLVLYKILNFEVSLGFQIAADAIGMTVLLFVGIFLLTFLNTLGQIHLAKPVELLRGGQTGEREPKTKWILTLIGGLCLSGGYYLSLTTKNPLAALMVFFVAVVLVIIGTYCLFTAGSIAVLKILRKRKRYYYQTRHFISVSGMMYRMKQNAAGLANICILATCVLVMLSTTLSLYIGVEDVTRTRYPRNIILTTYDVSDGAVERVRNRVDGILAEHQLTPQNALDYRYLSFAAVEENGTFAPHTNDLVFTNIATLYFVPLADYNRLMGRSVVLDEDEILLYTGANPYSGETLSVLGRTYTIAERADSFIGAEADAMQVYFAAYFVIVKDMDAMNQLNEAQKNAYGDGSHSIPVYYAAFDLDADNSAQLRVYNEISASLNEVDFPDGRVDSPVAAHESFYAVYGGLFFLGIFLGALFIMATVLIIYYKQISEGYDDKERFVIMQKVGMSQAEVKRAIHSQILTVFFLPLITAGIHIFFAFPVITRLLTVFNLTNVTLFAWCTAGTLLVFAVFYAIVYALTARVYYRIVS